MKAVSNNFDRKVTTMRTTQRVQVSGGGVANAAELPLTQSRAQWFKPSGFGAAFGVRGIATPELLLLLVSKEGAAGDDGTK